MASEISTFAKAQTIYARSTRIRYVSLTRNVVDCLIDEISARTHCGFGRNSVLKNSNSHGINLLRLIFFNISDFNVKIYVDFLYYIIYNIIYVL